MTGSWRLRWRVLWREDHIWAYYAGLLALFLGKFWFSIGDLLALIPLYGLFVTQLTLIILDQHRRHGMQKIVRLAEVEPFRNMVRESFFCFSCALPAIVLLTYVLHDAFPTTPFYLLVLLVTEFIGFAISFAFGCALLPFKYAVPVSLLFYFILLANHGYKLELIPYLAPTLNFMYPDYPDLWNAAAILALSLIFFTLYLWKKFDCERSFLRRMRALIICAFALYVSIPVIHTIHEHDVMTKPYHSMQVDGLDVRYRGVSQNQAERYAQVTADMHTELKERGIAIRITAVTVTRKNDIPQDEGIEHILRLDGHYLNIEPYSNKFYEFNYGYNILRDLTELLVQDSDKREEIVQSMILKDKRGFFRATRMRLGIED